MEGREGGRKESKSEGNEESLVFFFFNLAVGFNANEDFVAPCRDEVIFFFFSQWVLHTQNFPCSSDIDALTFSHKHDNPRVKEF